MDTSRNGRGTEAGTQAEAVPAWPPESLGPLGLLRDRYPPEAWAAAWRLANAEKERPAAARDPRRAVPLATRQRERRYWRGDAA